MTGHRGFRRRAPSDSPRVGFFGILCSGNLGNDGSLDAVVMGIRRRHPDARLGFFCMGPDEATARYGVPAVAMQWYERHAGSATGLRSALLKIIGRVLDTVRTVAWVRHYDVVIVPGMGVLETTTPTRPWAMPYSLFLLCAGARLFGTKVALVSVGANVIRQRATRWLLTAAARMAHYRSYRDPVSLAAMRQMGVDVSADAVYPDVAFALEAPQVISRARGQVGVGLMAFRGGSEERARAATLHRDYLVTMTRFVRWLIEDGRTVRLFPGDKEDEPVLAEIVRAVDPDPSPSPRVLAEPVATLDDLMRQMATVDVVIGTRYHNVLCALRLAKPTLSIGYAAKHHELMKGMGLGEFNVDAREIDLDLLIDRFTSLERRSGELTDLMAQRNREYAIELDEQFARLSAALFGDPPPRSALPADAA